MPANTLQPVEYDPLVVHSECPGFCVAHAGPLVVPVWTRTATVEHVNLIGKAQRHVLRRHPKFILLSIVRAELSMSVDNEVRERSKASIQEFGDSTVRSVLVVESGSLRASFFRSVITGLYFLSRNSSKQKVCTNIDDGLDWLLEPLQAGSEDAPPLGLEASDRIHAEVHQFADDVARRHPPV